ncbi:MAG TPA: DUF4145 domain-containing protein [Pyrinomonadaceae bacterium]|nr:DUF4145 domain-containing protein [Pyrinomonadaceae bacterium]
MKITPPQPKPVYEGFCPHCGPDSTQQLLFDLNGDRDADFSCLALIGCEDCRGILLYDMPFHLEGVDAFASAQLLWPPRDDLPDHVPENIRALYAGALKVKSHPDSFVVQLRRTIQAICVDLGARSFDRDGRPIDLVDMLRELSNRGVFPSRLSDVLHQIRYLGNVGAHSLDERVDVSVAHVVDELFRLLIQYMYVLPYRLDKLKEQTQTLKLKRGKEGGHPN